jgi:hypothetical protein
MDKYGDFRVGRTIIGERRVNSGMSVETITVARPIDAHDFQWLQLSAATIQNATLPDTNTVELGWSVVVHVPESSGATINVNKYGSTLLRNILKGRAYRFTLIDKTTSAGEWYVDYLEELESLPTVRYIHSFNATTNWGTASGGYYTITVPASTHNLGANPVSTIYELSGTDYIQVMADKTITATNGNVSIRVPETPNLRFAGQIIII